MKYICIFFIELYQKISKCFRKQPCCRFQPTCSHYAVSAFKKHGFFGGTFLSAKRILRCNPFSEGGKDPVPEKIFYKKDKQSKKTKNGEL